MRRWSWLRGLKRNTRKADGGSRLRNTRLRLEPLEQRSLLSASASLSIFVDGDAVALPANIGVASDGTLAEVYTSDSDGTLHIPDTSSSVTLEDFFAVWRTNAGQAGNRTDASFDSTGVLGNVIDSSHFLQMFVNGMASRELEDYTIQDGDEIAIIYTSHEVVSLNTNFGSLLLELYNDAAPGTVDNFLDYVHDGDYVNSIFHRLDSDFVIQGGGYITSSTTFTSTDQLTAITSHGTIENEPGISNTTGTVAMAKLSGDADSATSQFFINLADNTFLDSEDYGEFTVFATVLDMTTAEAIAEVPISSGLSSPYSELPVTEGSQLVVIQSISGEGTLTGSAFIDSDGDGVRDSSESGLSGATIFADADADGALDDGELSTITASDGSYTLRVPAASYVIRQVAMGDLSPSVSGYSAAAQVGVTTSVTAFANTGTSWPTATADTYSVAEDETLTVNSSLGVLANDSDPADLALSATVVESPQHGSLTLNADGSFGYVPDSDFHGTDSFSYSARNTGGYSSTTGVSITVTSVADSPSAVADSYTVTQDSSAQEFDVLDNDTSDPDDSQTLTVISVTQGVYGGTVSVSSDGSGVLYTPPADYVGTDSFTYTIQDSDGLTDTATVSITVSLGTDDTTDTSDEAIASISGYTYFDANSDGLRGDGETGIAGVMITLQGVDDQSTSVSRSVLTDSAGQYAFSGLRAGTYSVVQSQPRVTVDGTESAGTSGGTVGEDQVTGIVLGSGSAVTACDFGELGLKPEYISKRLFLASTPAMSVYLPRMLAAAEEAAGNTELAELIRSGATVVPGGTTSNSTPVAVVDSFTTSEDVVLSVSASEGLLANDQDADGDSLTAALVTNPSHGTITLSTDGSFSYTPDAGYSGTDSFTYRVSDGQAASAAATVVITVGTVNDVPVAVADSYQVATGGTLTVSATQGVLANDSDVEGDLLSASLVSTTTSGSLTLNHDGSFTYTPASGFHGTDQFVYRAYDSGGYSPQVTVSIVVNAATTVVSDSYGTDEDVVLSVSASEGVLANDQDSDGDSLTAALVAGPSYGTLSLASDGSFSYTPNAEYHGTDSFVYRVNDGQTDSASVTVTITVNSVNDTPTGSADSYEVVPGGALTVAASEGVLTNDTDIEGDTLSDSLVSTTTSGSLTLNDDGSFTYTPADGFHGTDQFIYRAYDGQGYSSQVNVSIVVDAAPALSDDAYSTDEDSDLTASVAEGLLANDQDSDGDSLTAALVSGPSHGTLSLNSDGSFSYSPNANYSGTDSFTYRVNDGYLDSTTATVAITVNAIAEQPVVIDDSYTVDEDGVLTVAASSGVLANDYDIDGSSLTVALVEGPQHGTLTLAADGSFAYTPAADHHGTDTFTYRANNGSIDSVAATVTIAVAPVEDVPVASGDTYQVNQDLALTITAAGGVLANDTDPDLDSLMASLVSTTTSGALTLNADGSFTYTPNEGFYGQDQFVYQVSDGQQYSAQVTVTITVNGVPTVIADSYTGQEDAALAIDASQGVLANDQDPETAALTAIVETGPTGGSLALQADGSFTYTPDANFRGTDSFTYRASDGAAASEVTTVTIVVTGVNDAPVAVADSYSVEAGATLEVAAEQGVLSNDQEVDGDGVSAVLAEGSTHGTLQLNADGSFTYTPDGDFSGTDSFTYRANDGIEDSAPAVVTLAVSQPEATADSSPTEQAVDYLMGLLAG